MSLRAERRRLKGGFPEGSGAGFSIADYNTKVQHLREKLALYNQAKTMMEKTQNALVDAEKELNSYSEHMLLSVASRYGKDSDEYGMAGGTRKSNRRKPRPAVRHHVKISCTTFI